MLKVTVEILQHLERLREVFVVVARTVRWVRQHARQPTSHTTLLHRQVIRQAKHAFEAEVCEKIEFVLLLKTQPVVKLDVVRELLANGLILFSLLHAH